MKFVIKTFVISILIAVPLSIVATRLLVRHVEASEQAVPRDPREKLKVAIDHFIRTGDRMDRIIKAQHEEVGELLAALNVMASDPMCGLSKEDAIAANNHILKAADLELEIDKIRAEAIADPAPGENKK